MVGTKNDSCPKDLDDLLQQIEGMYLRLPKKMQEIASFSFEHPDRMALDTITELADQTRIHPSAFVRYAKQFGLSGFSDLQKLYRDNFRGQLSGYQSRLQTINDADSEEVLEAISKSAIQSANELYSNIDRKALSRCVALIANANIVWLAGTGRTVPVKNYLQYLLTGLGIVSQPLNENLEVAVAQVDLFSKNDVLIAPSFKPYGRTTIAVFEKATLLGIPTISMTDTTLSPIHGENSLLYHENEFAGFRSLSATINLSLYLAMQAGRIKGQSKSQTPHSRRSAEVAV